MKTNEVRLIDAYALFKRRAKTFQGIARAMAEQWAGKCEEETR